MLDKVDVFHSNLVQYNLFFSLNVFVCLIDLVLALDLLFSI